MANLLLVDDDALSVQVLADLVAAHGHTVARCSGAGDALAALARAGATFDAVITDVRMPEMDGIDLVKRIRARFSGLPVALMSAEPDFDIYEEAATRGVDAQVLLQKPFQLNAVRRVLEQLLGAPTPVADSPPAASPPNGQPAVPLGRDDAPGWLAQAEVPIFRLPPVRTWFVASRRRASGLLRLNLPGTEVVLPIRRGEVLRRPGQDRDADELARWLLELHDGSVRFEACPPELLTGEPVAGALSVPDAVTHALARVPHVTIQDAWRSVLSAKAFARAPKDSQPEAWGLDALARLAHDTARGQRVNVLVLELARQSPAFRTSGFRTLEMLQRLNLLTLVA